MSLGPAGPDIRFGVSLKALFKREVLPDPRGPNRKKLDFFGNLISLLNMIYNSPTFIYHAMHIMSIWIT
jgi:hypothetical protein